MHNESISREAEAFVYVTNMMRAGTVSFALGILLAPIIYLLSDRSIAFWFYFIFLVLMSGLVAKYNASWRFNKLKKHSEFYSEVGLFWIQKRSEMVNPKNALKWFMYALRSCFILGEWKMMVSVNLLYLFLIIIPLLLELIHIQPGPGYEVLFVILLWYEIISFHAFFIFLYWKYKISKKIKEEFGLDYKTLVSIN